MYGTRDAASDWEDCYIGFLERLGFSSGVESACVFRQRSRRVRLTVHGDDFALLAPVGDLDLFEKTIKDRGFERHC